jgi:hypothetical protein
MSEKIIFTESDKSPHLEPCDYFVNKVHGNFYELVHKNRSDVLGNNYRSGMAFEMGARYAIEHIEELVTTSSLRDFAEHLHKRYFIDDKQRAQLIEKFATMTFADCHSPDMVTEALPQIKTMVDAIINCQCIEKTISKTEEI